MEEGALKKLGCERYTGMVIQTECVRKAPCCLLVDGLQLSTGCTFGNRNILFISSPRIRVSFTSTQTGERVNYVLADGLWSMIEEWSKTWESDETAGLPLHAVP
jgi:formylmethanofuran dehydrogenase subunit E